MPFWRFGVTDKNSQQKIGCHGNVSWGIEKNNSRLFIYGQISTISANFVKIGLVDVEIIGLKEITKKYN